MKSDGKILAVDTGLTSCKALIFSLDGKVLGEAQETTPIVSDCNGLSEINMDNLWNVACKAISKVLSSIDSSGQDIKCAGFSGHGNGLYCIDKNGFPVGAAVTSMDAQASEEITKLTESQVSFIEEKSMQHLWAGQPGMILRRMKKHQPGQYEKIGRIFFCKDYLSFKMCGNASTDFGDVSASGLLDNADGRYTREMFKKMGIPEVFDKLPEIVQGDEIRAGVSAKASHETGISEGVPVIGGMFDVDACVYGSGITSTGGACSIAGTWNINAVISDKMFFNPDIRQCIRRTDGKTALLIESSATSTVNIEWYLKKLLGFKSKYDFSDDYLKSYEFSESSPYFLPFINGHLGTNVQEGAFIGLDITCGKEKLFASIFEGICFAHRYHIENLEKSGKSIEKIRITGGAAKWTVFCRFFSDITGKRVETVNFSQSGAFGIWAATVSALGLYKNIESALKDKVITMNAYSPDSSRYELFCQRYKKFKELIKCRL